MVGGEGMMKIITAEIRCMHCQHEFFTQLLGKTIDDICPVCKTHIQAVVEVIVVRVGLNDTP